MSRFVSVTVIGMVAVAAGAPVLLAGGDGPAGTLKGDLSPAQYNRIVNPIEAKVALAARAMVPYEREMAKPEEKRRLAVLISCKEKASAAYYQAALAARKAAKRVKKEEHKREIKGRYEDPNLRKATGILLEFAAQAQQKRDVRKAVAYYKRVLGMDPNNAHAKKALARIAKSVMKAVDKMKKERDKDDKDLKYKWKKGGGL